MWDFLFNKENRRVLAFLGGGLVVLVSGVWTTFTYFDSKSSKTPSASPALITTGNIQSDGDTVIGPGTIDKRTYYGVADIEVVKQLGVAESALKNFLILLNQKNIRPEWDTLFFKREAGIYCPRCKNQILKEKQALLGFRPRKPRSGIEKILDEFLEGKN